MTSDTEYLAEITEVVRGIPHMNPRNGERMFRFVLQQRFADCLELGFAHGVSSCYIAGALRQLRQGRLLSVDMEAAEARTPSIEQLVDRLQLRRYVDWIYEPRSYTWFLMRALEEGQQYDFCFIDGAHTWDTDGFAFCLVDRLLRPGGWIVFDDMDWTYATSPSLAQADWVKEKPPLEQTTKGVRKVFELLVDTHPAYVTHEEDGWGFAQKLPTSHAPLT